MTQEVIRWAGDCDRPTVRLTLSALVWPPSVQHGLEVLVLFLHPVREEISVMFASLSPSFNRFALVRAENVYLKS